STSREEIVECTIKMLSRVGAGALTFRGVARELGVAMNALYTYFKNLADLEDAVAAKIMGGLRPLSSESKKGLREQLIELGMDFLDINRKYPFLLNINGPQTALASVQHMKLCLKALDKAGVDHSRAFLAYSLLGTLAFAWGTRSHSFESAAWKKSVEIF